MFIIIFANTECFYAYKWFIRSKVFKQVTYKLYLLYYILWHVQND